MADLLFNKHYSGRIQNRRDFIASRLFTYRNASTIATGGIDVVDWEMDAPVSRRYLPFNFLKVHNTSTTYSIELWINGDSNNVLHIDASQVLTMSESELPAFWSATIKNIGAGNITANQIVVQAKRVNVNSEGIISRITNRLLGGGGDVFYG